MAQRRPKIMIVDDEAAILTMLQQVLGSREYDISVTTSGIEALFLLAQDDYQLLITDINMPRMDGLELTRRALQKHPELAIILTTAGNNRDRAYSAYELGAAGYLLKPFDPNEIRIYVANTLRLRELEIANAARLIQLEKRVETSENYLGKVVSQLSVVFWAVDLDGVFILSEGRALRALGLRPGQVVGQSALELYAHLPAVVQSIQRALSGETFSERLWVNERLFESHYSPLTTADGELNGTICISIDITEAHQLQEEVTRKQRLAALGELAAGVAHEINNPNALILLNSRELVKIFADIAPLLEAHYQRNGDFRLGQLNFSEIREDLPQLLEHIVDSAQRIKVIVSDLKDFTSSDEKPVREWVDLNQVVKSAIPFAQQEINASTENFSVTYSPEPLPVKCFSKRLEQVVINLIQNACQSLHDRSGKITLNLTHDKENNRQVLTVADDGCGISAENLTRIKEPFFTTRRNCGGTGLGLSVSAQMVEECSGKLEFLSRLGVGTTAILSFPTRDEDTTL